MPPMRTQKRNFARLCELYVLYVSLRSMKTGAFEAVNLEGSVWDPDV